MTAGENIDYTLPLLETKDTVAKALDLIEEFHVVQYAVVEGKNYKGLVSEGMLLNIVDSDVKLEKIAFEYADVFVHSSDHFFEVLKVADLHKLKVVPILDDQGDFLGVFNLAEAAPVFAKICSTEFEGGIIILAVNEKQYSLADICRIAESNNIKVLSAYAARNTQREGGLIITVKLNRNDLSTIIKSLERYSYEILAQFSHTEIYNEDKERLDLFLRFLNI
jgi:acetoin utilization protein AcuB